MFLVMGRDCYSHRICSVLVVTAVHGFVLPFDVVVALNLFLFLSFIFVYSLLQFCLASVPLHLCFVTLFNLQFRSVLSEIDACADRQTLLTINIIRE